MGLMQDYGEKTWWHTERTCKLHMIEAIVIALSTKVYIEGEAQTKQQGSPSHTYSARQPFTLTLTPIFSNGQSRVNS